MSARSRMIGTLVAAVMMVLPAWVSAAAEKASGAEGSSAGRAYLGVRLDQQPLPELLRLHLGLGENEGLLVLNVQKDSPAEQAGIEKYDVLVGFQGKPVQSHADFVAAIHDAGVGAKVRVTVIHKGRRGDVAATLAAYNETKEWKYPQEEGQVRAWRMAPGEPGWRPTPFGQMPEAFRRFFRERRVLRSQEGGRQLEIMIEGDPASSDAQVRVRDLKTNQEYQAPADDLDKLPAAYRDEARKAVEDARQGTGGFEFRLEPFLLPDEQAPFGQRFREWRDSHQDDIAALRQELGQMQEKLQQEMEKKMQQLEESTRQLRQDVQKLLQERGAGQPRQQGQESGAL